MADTMIYKILENIFLNKKVAIGSMIFRGLIIFSILIILSISLVIFIDTVAFKRLRNDKSNLSLFLVSSIGVTLIVSEFVSFLTKSGPISSHHWIPYKNIFTLNGVAFRNDYLVAIVLAISWLIALKYTLKFRQIGLKIKSVQGDPTLSRLSGINPQRVIIMVSILSGFLLSCSAMLYMNIYANTSYNIGFSLGLYALTGAILGGIGTEFGAIWGSLLVGVCGQFAGAVFGSQWQEVVIFLMLLIIIFFKPTGIFSTTESLRGN